MLTCRVKAILKPKWNVLLAIKYQHWLLKNVALAIKMLYSSWIDSTLTKSHTGFSRNCINIFVVCI